MISEQFLVQNLAALKESHEHHPSFAALNPETTRVLAEGDAVRIEIKSAAGDEWVPLWGDDPADDARRQLAEAGDAAHIFVIGAGVGHLLDALEAVNSAARVTVLEPDPGLAVLLLARRDLRSWLTSGRLRLLTGPDYLGASSLARHVDGGRPCAIVVNPVVARHRPQAAERAQTLAKRIVSEAAANAEARRRFAGRYLLQTLANLRVIEREGDVAALDGAFFRRPAVIAAAGPSLDRALPVLAEYQDRVVVIGADTTLRPLLAGRVRPHLMVGVDPNDVNARHLAGLDDSGGIWLAAEGSLHPSVFPGFAGRTFIFKVSNHHPWPWFAEAGFTRGTLRAWGSVVTSAFDLAVRLGCDPIVFVGHDFAFTGGRPYCDNTVFHLEWRTYLQGAWGTVREDLMRDYENQMMAGRPLVPATDINGTPTHTASNLVAFRDWIAEQTTILRDRKFINATGAGLLHGSRIAQMPLDAALAAHAVKPVDVRSVLAILHARSVREPGILVGRIPSAETRSAWAEFSAGTVSDDEILAAMRG